MKIAHRKTDFCVWFKSTAGGDHENGWGFEGVPGGEDDLAVVIATLVLAVLVPFQDVVPFEEVGGGGECSNAGQWVLCGCVCVLWVGKGEGVCEKKGSWGDTAVVATVQQGVASEGKHAKIIPC